MDDNPKKMDNIDVNSPEFYDQVQSEIESDMARMKKSVEILLKLRVEAAELEVETAALFHAELWYHLLDTHKDDSEDISEDEDELDDNEMADTGAT